LLGGGGCSCTPLFLYALLLKDVTSSLDLVDININFNFNFSLLNASPLQVSCSQCGESIERELLVIHERDKCLQRIVTCGYCEFPLPAVDLDKHLVRSILSKFQLADSISNWISKRTVEIYTGVTELFCVYVYYRTSVGIEQSIVIHAASM
jgi:hypothetical protein